MEKIGNFIFFDSESEFEDFCVMPYAIIKQGTYVGQYSSEYKECIKNGLKFAIKDRNCKAVKDNWVTKRVKVKIEDSSREVERAVQLKVQNVVWDSPLVRKKAKMQALKEIE